MRNKIALFGILAFIICSVSVGFVVTPVSAEQELNLWPMFHHDLQHTGRSPYFGPLAEPPELKWSYATDGPVGSSPAIGLDGTVYIGSYDHHLHAINPDGTRKWRYFTTTFDGKISCSPAISTDGPYPVIYFGTHEPTSTGDPNFFAIEDQGPNNPVEKWPPIHIDHSVVTSSPAIGADGTIYVGTWEGTLYAINSNNGAIHWSCIISAPEAILSSPAVRTTPTPRIYVGANDYRLHAIDDLGAGSPDPKWSFMTGGYVISSPAIKDDIIYVGSADGRLYAIRDNGLTCSLVWKYPPAGNPSLEPILSSPAIGEDGTIYIGTGTTYPFTINGRLYAINPDGTLKWQYPTTPSYVISSSPAIGSAVGTIEEVIYFGASDGRVYAINHAGTLRWMYPTTPWGAIGSSPAIAPGGELYIGSADNNVYCIAGENVFIKDHPDDNGIIPSWDANHNGIWEGIPPDRAYWISPDIRVDRPPYWPPGPPPGQGPNEENPVRGETDRLHAYVHNIGSVTATSTVVKFYWADYGVGNPPWPGGFTLIGNCVIPTIAPGATEYCFVSWDVPTNIPNHTCIWVKLISDTDPIVSDDPGWENNIGWKNFYIEPSKGTPVGDYRVTVDFKVRNPDNVTRNVLLDLYLEDWPYNWTVELTSHDPRFHPPLDHPVLGYVNKYVFSSMDAGEDGDVTLSVIAPEGTENNTGTIHIAGTIDNRPIGGVSVKVVPPIRKIPPEFIVARINNSIYYFPYDETINAFGSSTLIDTLGSCTGSPKIDGRVVDFDNDGDFDVLIDTSTWYVDRIELIVYENTGTTFVPTWRETQPGLGAAWGDNSFVVAGDFDEDGDWDFIQSVVNQTNSYTYDIDFYAWGNDWIPGGTLTFRPLLGFSINTSPIAHPSDMESADFDNDGHLDLLIGDYPHGAVHVGEAYLYTGNSRWGFVTPASPCIEVNTHHPQPIPAMVSGDFYRGLLPVAVDVIVGLDDDGDPGQTFLFSNDGTGVFTQVTQFPSNPWTSHEPFDLNKADEYPSYDRPGGGCMDAKDFDKDGMLDIVASGGIGFTNPLWYLRGLGSGTFGHACLIHYNAYLIAAPERLFKYVINETEYKNSITQRINVSKIHYKFIAVDEEWAAKWTNEILYGQKETKYSIAVYLNETGYVTRVDFERWGFPITEIPYKLAEQSLASLPPGFAIDP